MSSFSSDCLSFSLSLVLSFCFCICCNTLSHAHPLVSTIWPTHRMRRPKNHASSSNEQTVVGNKCSRIVCNSESNILWHPPRSSLSCSSQRLQCCPWLRPAREFLVLSNHPLAHPRRSRAPGAEAGQGCRRRRIGGWFALFQEQAHFHLHR